MKRAWVLWIGLSFSLISWGRHYPIDLEVSPCQDFYGYICNPVIKNFSLPENRSYYNFAFGDLRENMLAMKKNYLKQLARRKPINNRETILKNYYLSWIDLEAKKREERELVYRTKQLLARIETKEIFLEKAAENILDLSNFSFLRLQLDLINQKAVEYRDVAFDIGLLQLPEKSYYQNKALLADYQKLLVDFFRWLGSKNPEKQAKVILSFEQKLAHYYPSPEIIRDRYTKPLVVSRAELMSLRNLQLEKTIDKLPKKTVIRNIIGLEPLRWLNLYLSDISLDDLKTIALFYQLFPMLEEAAPELFRAKFNFASRYLGGPLKRPNLEERATLQVMNAFTMEIDAELLPRIFPNFSRTKIEKLVERIQRVLLVQFLNNQWLSTGAREEAFRKIANIKWYLVAPQTEQEWNFNPRLAYDKKKPLTNYLRLQQALLVRDLAKLKGKVNGHGWLVGPLSVNAYYEPSFNSIILPIGILQPPFYDQSLPEDVNLGGIGVVLGHEMAHAVDQHGSRYNANGVLSGWMNLQDRREFKNRTAKLISLFNKVGQNGSYTLGENIADLVGLTTAYQALRELNPSVSVLKKFFAQYARLWCEVNRPSFRELRLKTDPHALGVNRVNQQLKLQPAFCAGYGCREEDPMKNKEVIEIW